MIPPLRRNQPQNQQPDPRAAADAELAALYASYQSREGYGQLPQPFLDALSISRVQAAEDAEQARNDEEFLKKIKAKTPHKATEKIKEKLQKARKPKMRTVEHFLCDSCDQPITNPSNGFIIHGNIYTADPSQRGGIIGNNFPEVPEGEKIEPEAVRQTVMCRHCFIKALGLGAPPPSKIRWSKGGLGGSSSDVDLHLYGGGDLTA